MNVAIKVLITLALLLGIGYFVVITLTAQAQESLANCHIEANRNLEGIMKDYTPTNPNARNICASASTEVQLMQQCINNAYGKYGRYESALARHLLYLGKSDPVAQTIQNHNAACEQYPDTTVK